VIGLGNYPLVLRRDLMPASAPPGWLWIACIVSVVLAAVAYLAWRRWLTGGIQRKNEISLGVLLVLVSFILGFPCTVGYLCLLNGGLDHSAVAVHQVRLLRTTKSSGKTTTYYFVAEDWQRPQHEVWFEVRRRVYAAHRAGAPLVVTTRSGWLGQEWLQSIN
jgi:hypothetical protein